jgi:putative MFS transporter
MTAAGLAAVLIPLTGWRIAWFAQLPLVLVLIGLNRWIPESAAFAAQRARTRRVPAATLFTRVHRTKTLVVGGYALAWGLVYWGFITFLPSQLESSHPDGMSAATLLFISSLLSIPTCVVAAWLYMRWSARGTMVVYAALTVAALLLLALVGMNGGRPVLLTAVMLLFAGTAGVIALIGPYTAEIYPLAIRGTAGGWAAAVGKSGGAFGPPLVALVLSVPGGMRTAAVFVALPVALAGTAVALRGSDPRAVAAGSGDTADRLDAELDALVHGAGVPATGAPAPEPHAPKSEEAPGGDPDPAR